METCWGVPGLRVARWPASQSAVGVFSNALGAPNQLTLRHHSSTRGVQPPAGHGESSCRDEGS